VKEGMEGAKFFLVEMEVGGFELEKAVELFEVDGGAGDPGAAVDFGGSHSLS